MLLIYFLLFFLAINIMLDQYYKKKYIKENFPPKIIFPVKELSFKELNVSEGKEIPKKIYRCYSTFEKMKKFQGVFDKTKELMPDYEQVFFDDLMIDEYIKNNFEERIYNAYNKINPEYGAAKADFFRYLIIYKEGGIYMDIKSGPIQKINNFFDTYKNKLLVSVGINNIPHFIPKKHLIKLFNLTDDWSYVTKMWQGSEWQQFIIAAPKGNIFLKQIIMQVVSNIENGILNKKHYNKGNISVVAMTGPIVYSLVIEKFKNRKEYKDKIEFFLPSYNYRFKHSIIKDYKKIMGKEHYSKIKNKNILVDMP